MKKRLRDTFAIAVVIAPPTLWLALDEWRRNAPTPDGVLYALQNHNSNFLWSLMLVPMLAAKLQKKWPQTSATRHIAVATAALVAMNVGYESTQLDLPDMMSGILGSALSGTALLWDNAINAQKSRPSLHPRAKAHRPKTRQTRTHYQP